LSAISVSWFVLVIEAWYSLNEGEIPLIHPGDIISSYTFSNITVTGINVLYSSDIFLLEGETK